MTTGRCFKRICFSRCAACPRPVSLWRRLRCFVTYVTWHTDPVPVEMMLGYILAGLAVVLIAALSAGIWLLGQYSN